MHLLLLIAPSFLDTNVILKQPKRLITYMCVDNFLPLFVIGPFGLGLIKFQEKKSPTIDTVYLMKARRNSMCFEQNETILRLIRFRNETFGRRCRRLNLPWFRPAAILCGCHVRRMLARIV